MKTLLRSKLTFANVDKVRQMQERFGADRMLADKAAFEHALENGREGIWLNLTDDRVLYFPANCSEYLLDLAWNDGIVPQTFEIEHEGEVWKVGVRDRNNYYAVLIEKRLQESSSL